jgi:hypothetical protein
LSARCSIVFSSPSRRCRVKSHAAQPRKMQIPLRDQGVGGSNPLAPTIQIQPDSDFFAERKSHCGVAFVGGAFRTALQVVDSRYLLPTALHAHSLNTFVASSAWAIAPPSPCLRQELGLRIVCSVQSRGWGLESIEENCALQLANCFRCASRCKLLYLLRSLL